MSYSQLFYEKPFLEVLRKEPIDYWEKWRRDREEAQLWARQTFGTGISGVIGQREIKEYKEAIGFEPKNLGLYLIVGLIGLIILGLAWRR